MGEFPEGSIVTPFTFTSRESSEGGGVAELIWKNARNMKSQRRGL
jgi:hypothetical protein